MIIARKFPNDTERTLFDAKWAMAKVPFWAAREQSGAR